MAPSLSYPAYSLTSILSFPPSISPSPTFPPLSPHLLLIFPPFTLSPFPSLLRYPPCLPSLLLIIPFFTCVSWFQGAGAAFEAGGLRVGQVILQVDGVTTLGKQVAGMQGSRENGR
jgi:hypothetical protein